MGSENTVETTTVKEERVYVFKTEEELKAGLAAANTADKKVPFKGIRMVISSPIPVGTHYVMAYSPREAGGQLLAHLGVEGESIDGPQRAARVPATPEEAVELLAAWTPEQKKAMAKLLNAAAK